MGCYKPLVFKKKCKLFRLKFQILELEENLLKLMKGLWENCSNPIELPRQVRIWLKYSK